MLYSRFLLAVIFRYYILMFAYIIYYVYLCSRVKIKKKPRRGEILITPYRGAKRRWCGVVNPQTKPSLEEAD